MITHKIERVSDELCNLCAQCWKNECRAFQISHSANEKKHRQADTALCSIPIFTWAYDLAHPERHNQKTA